MQQDSPYDSRAAKACNGTTLAAHLQSCTTMHNSMHPWWLTSRSDMRCYRDQDTATRGLAGSGGLDLSLACDRGREG